MSDLINGFKCKLKPVTLVDLQTHDNMILDTVDGRNPTPPGMYKTL